MCVCVCVCVFIYIYIWRKVYLGNIFSFKQVLLDKIESLLSFSLKNTYVLWVCFFLLKSEICWWFLQRSNLYYTEYFLTRTKSTRYNINNSLGEIINKFQDFNKKKQTNIPHQILVLLKEEKKETPKQQGFYFILFNKTYLKVGRVSILAWSTRRV